MFEFQDEEVHLARLPDVRRARHGALLRRLGLCLRRQTRPCLPPPSIPSSAGPGALPLRPLLRRALHRGTSEHCFAYYINTGVVARKESILNLY